MTLDELRDAVAKGQLTAALDGALAAWRETKAPALAALVDAISARLGEPLADGKHATWMERASSSSAEEVRPLLDGLLTPEVGTLGGRVEALLARGADPRIAMKLAEMALEPPMTSSSNFPIWTKIFAYLIATADPRVVPLLKKRVKAKPGPSQFWPKLYANLEKVIPKIPAAPKLSAKDEKAAATIAKAATKAKANPTAAKTVTVAPTLDGALVAARGEDWPSCLDALLAVWRTTRQGEVGTLVDRVSERINEGVAPPTGDDKTLAKAWNALAAKRTSADIGRLAESSCDGKLADSEARFDAMLGWPADPRIGRAAFAIMYSARFRDRARGTKSLQALLKKNADPRSEVPLKVAPLGASDAKLVAELGELLDTPTTEKKLVAAIEAAPNDDAPRLVYADWLTERGHPRGEFIVLQCGKASDESNARIQELIDDHGRALIGTAAAFCDASKAKFSRGFMTALEVRVGVPRWTFAGTSLLGFVETVSSLSFAVDALPGVIAACPRVKMLDGVKKHVLADLVAAGVPLPIEALRIDHGGETDEALADVPANAAKVFPRLKAIELFAYSHFGKVGPSTWASPLVKNVESLALPARNLGAVLADAQKAKAKLKQLSFIHRTYESYRVDVILGANQKPKDVRVSLYDPNDPYGSDTGKVLNEILDSLPRGLPVKVDKDVPLEGKAKTRKTT